MNAESKNGYSDIVAAEMAARQEAAVLLNVAGLHARYGKVEALHGVSLKVKSGSIITVIGPNGAGKSTLLNAMMGTLPGSATAHGRIDYLGQDIAAMEVEERVARGLSLVPERRELFTTMTVEDNLQLGAYKRRRNGEAHYLDQLDSVYDLFPRLAERRKQTAGTLSGGERQMLAVGRALMAKPRVLMLDEPSLGLAPLITKEILGIIGKLRDSGVATLLVEQNARAALQVADYAYVLEMGELVNEGPAHVLASDKRIVESYLGLAR